MSTLLEKALAVPVRNKTQCANKEHADLALAWIQGRITLGQAATGLGLNNPSSAYCSLAMALRAAFESGLLVIADKTKGRA